MLVSQILEQFYKQHPTYRNIGYSLGNVQYSERLHPLFVFTQYIIDTMISKGEKRIAIVLPDDDCNILPFILAKCFANIQDEPGFAGSVLDEIKPGQMLRLGDAVVKYLGREGDRIKYSIGRTQVTEVTSPIFEYHNFFEKSSGAVSSWGTYIKAKKKIDDKIKSGDNNELNAIKLKRTTIKKTTMLLSAKNDFRDFMNQVKINNNSADDIITYGEIDLQSGNGFALYNKGKLDCLPAITVSARLDEINDALQSESVAGKVIAIFSTVDKFDEIIDNIESLKECLRKKIPFVVFVPEQAFEKFAAIKNLGFKVWHWKPATLKSEAFLKEDVSDRQERIFGSISKKINSAALAEYDFVKCFDNVLKTNLRLIRDISFHTNDGDAGLKQLVRRLWGFQNEIVSTCYMDVDIVSYMRNEFSEIKEAWNRQKIYYEQQSFYESIEKLISFFEKWLSASEIAKQHKLSEYLLSLPEEYKTIFIVVPDRFIYGDKLQKWAADIFSDKQIRVMKLTDFFMVQEKSWQHMDLLIITSFDRNQYIRIKQTYCYGKLTYILYDFENKWRSGLVKKIDECMPYDEVKERASEIGLSENDLLPISLDRANEDITDEGEHEIEDYNFGNTIIRNTLKTQESNRESATAIECVPILLSDDKIAYFYPTHDVIDITSLITFDAQRPLKKDAVRLRRGDKILIRQSDKDIIREKADILMEHDNNGDIRGVSEIWCTLLQCYAADKSITQVWQAIIGAGASCTFQQVRYWISGETILPRDRNVLVAIGKICLNNPELAEIASGYIEKMDAIIECGRQVQSYHQKAGIWVTKELRSKAAEIRKIAMLPSPYGNIEGIGDVFIYTVEDVLDKMIVERNKMNRVESLY